MNPDDASWLPSPERAAQMIDINLRYAQCFLDGDFDGMEECLVETPVFEAFPEAVRITGREAVRVRSERLFATTMRQLDPRTGENTHEISAVGFGEDVLIHEFSNEFEMPDGTMRRCHMLAVVQFEGDKMVGERVYTDRYLDAQKLETMGADFYDLPGVTQIADDDAAAGVD